MSWTSVLGNKCGMDVSNWSEKSSSRIGENSIIRENIFDDIGPKFSPIFANYTYEQASNPKTEKYYYMLKVVGAP